MYDTLNLKNTSELYLLREGWLSPKYELTDRVYTYGKITYRRSAIHKATALTAMTVWIFKPGSFFNRSVLITDKNGETIGIAKREWFSRRTKLTLESGFSAEFYKPNFFSFEYTWESAGYGKIMEIKSHAFRSAFNIHIDQSNTPPALIPLLIFLGSYLNISRRRRKGGVIGNILAIFGGNFNTVPIVNTGTYQQ